MKEGNEAEITDSTSESGDEDSDSNDSGTDSSESSSSDSNFILNVSYHLRQEKALSLEKHYICHMCGSTSVNQIATASSNFVCSVYDLNDLKNIGTFEGHTKSVTNLRFNPSDPHQLISSSLDGTIRFWDIRKPGKSTLTFKDDTAESGHLKPFLSFDVSKSGQFLCAGTELFEGDAFLVFGDARSVKVLGGYWESHSDDITQVVFNPVFTDSVASGSSDGLINIYDLKSENEDDALISSLNTESTVDKLQWYILNGKHKGISCILDTMDVQMWNQDEAAPTSTFSRKQIAKTTGWKADESYIVNLHQTSNGELMFLTGGRALDSERLALLLMKDNGLIAESELPGNKQRVRCSWFSDKNNSFITAGEGGIISMWMPGEEPQSNTSRKVLPKQTSSKHKPY